MIKAPVLPARGLFAASSYIYIQEPKVVDMKFFIAEGNLGGQASRAQVDQLIQMLRNKGWDVEYGAARNRATDISEFGHEEKIQDDFAKDFMECLAQIDT